MNNLQSHGDAASKSMGSVKEILHHLMRGVQNHRGWFPIHASDITKEGSSEFCPRQVALHMISGDVPNRETITGCNQYMFDLGRFIEHLIRDTYLKDYVFGHWKCLSCGAKSDYPMMNPKECGCGSANIQYEELVLPRMGVATCGIDMLVLLPGDNKLTLYEIKSLERKYFDTILAPKSEHTNRTRYYLGFIADDPHLSQIVHLDKAKVLYACKGWGRKDEVTFVDGVVEKFSPFAEFEVPADDHTVDYYDKRLIPIVEFNESGKVPEGICKSINSPRAKACPKRSVCFSSYPAGESVK